MFVCLEINNTLTLINNNVTFNNYTLITVFDGYVSIDKFFLSKIRQQCIFTVN